MGMSSRMIRDHLSASPTFVTSLAAVADGQFVPVPGGVLIEDVDEFAIGAIGISGDTSEKDEYCAIRAVQAGTVLAARLLLPGWTIARFFQSQLLQHHHLASTMGGYDHALPQRAFPSPQYRRPPMSWLR